jgi:hypothetical protein
VAMPISLQVRMIRRAISPRLAIKILEKDISSALHNQLLALIG